MSPREVLVFERNAHQQLAGLPYVSVTSAILSGLKDVLGFPSGLSTLMCEGKAAQVRLALKTSKNFNRLNELRKRTCDFVPFSEECRSYTRFPRWLSNGSIFAHINSSIEFANRVDESILYFKDNNMKRLQQYVSKKIRASTWVESPNNVLFREG